jgi:hypothetical protein
MPANIAAQGGQGQINFFEFYSNYDRPKVDMSGGIIELNYFESILEPTIRVTATFADTGYRENEDSAVTEDKGLKLTVGEKVELKMTDGYDKTLSFIGDKHLRIKEPRQTISTTNKVLFTVDFFTKEAIDNELVENRVKQRYDGKISDSVSRILTEVLKTPKSLDIDSTLNLLSFIGNIEKPFYKTAWLAPRSVPDSGGSAGKLAGFLFYETYDGFKFKSIDKLFEQTPKRNLIFNNLIGEIPPMYNAKILQYSFMSSLNFNNILKTGSHLKTQIDVVNTYESEYRRSDFGSSEQFNGNNNGGKEQPTIAKDLDIQNKATKRMFKFDDQGSIVEGNSLSTQLPKSKNLNYNNDEILRQSYMRYNNLFSTKLSIAIPGDFEIRAGDLIHCDFPEVSSSTTKLVSEKVSGVYLVSDLCHHITKNGCYTRLNLVRDSIGRKSIKI